MSRDKFLLGLTWPMSLSRRRLPWLAGGGLTSSQGMPHANMCMFAEPVFIHSKSGQNSLQENCACMPGRYVKACPIVFPCACSPCSSSPAGRFPRLHALHMLCFPCMSHMCPNARVHMAASTGSSDDRPGKLRKLSSSEGSCRMFRYQLCKKY